MTIVFSGLFWQLENIVTFLLTKDLHNSVQVFLRFLATFPQVNCAPNHRRWNVLILQPYQSFAINFCEASSVRRELLLSHSNIQL